MKTGANPNTLSFSSDNPYYTHASELRAMLADPAVNTFEHEVNEPRLLALMPLHGIRRVLDFGAGDGHFTRALRQQYPEAEIIGTDASPAMLPTHGYCPPAYEPGSVYYEPWNGMLPRKSDLSTRALDLQRRGKFDLVVAKLVFHYIDPFYWGSVAKALRALTARGGSLVCSVPHPQRTAEYIQTNSPHLSVTNPNRINGRIWYAREIGQTGIHAQMLHMPLEHWVRYASEAHGSNHVGIDEVGNEKPKRLNMLFAPQPVIHSQLASRSGDDAPFYRTVTDLY